jgi:hypothetical protein
MCFFASQLTAPAGPRDTRADESMLETLTTAWVRSARRAWVAVLIAALAGSIAAFEYVRTHLGMNTDTADMIAPSLAWRQRAIDFDRQFPHFSDTLAVVVDARTPDMAAHASARLARALAARGELFEEVQDLEDLPFFRRNALLFLDAAERDRLASDLITAQPLLARLHRDPGLAAMLDLFADAIDADVDVAPQVLASFSRRLAEAMDAALAGRQAHYLSWRAVLASGEADGDAARRVLVVSPVLDYSRLFAAQDAIEAVRATARELGLTAQHGVSVRITGGVAMSNEELRSVSSGAGRAALLALLGVALVLALGLGSVRLVCATLVTLLAGLLWTAAFAAAAVGHLNMISVAFAVLYIGLGVDYAVHFALRYRERLRDGLVHGEALDRAAGDVGVSIALCALTTGAGFFAFLPTRFAGVSELGLIAGTGMFVSLAATLTLMPALLTLLTLLRPRGGARARLGVQLPLAGALDRLGQRHPRRVAAAAALIGALCAVTAAGVRFDDNPLNLRDPDGEAVSTYRELVADADSWSLDVLLPDLATLRATVARLEALPEVSATVSVFSFVPADQDAALARAAELALLLGPDLDAPPGTPSPARAAQPALERLQRLLTPRAVERFALHALDRSLDRFAAALDGTATPAAREALLARLQDSVTATLPGELARLGALLDAAPVTLANLPPELLRDWRAPDGRYRLRVDAAGDLNERAVLERFVREVRRVAPGAVGTPVVHLESAAVVVGAFVQAFALALVCIAAILYLVFRRALEVAVVLIPLLLAVLASAAVMVLAQVPFNFANVIALPLLLGVGVDSGVHLLMRARAGDTGLAASSTARGIVTSALTTMVSFGNLAFSPHPGTASMGLLLSVGLVAIVISTLLLLPALVQLVPGLHSVHRATASAAPGREFPP